MDFTAFCSSPYKSGVVTSVSCAFVEKTSTSGVNVEQIWKQPQHDLQVL
jgi:hypothetical protein